MKKKFFILSLYLSLLTTALFAQTNSHEKKASRILNEVSQRYKKLNTIEAHFSFTLSNPTDHLNETQAGVLYVQPSGNKYHLVLNGQEIFSDGKLTYTYLKAQKEIQITNPDTNSETINPARIFSMYETGFTSSYNKEIRQGKLKLDLIDLSPVHPKKVVKAQIAVIRHSHQIYQIHSYDKGGNQVTITVNQFIPNPQVNNDQFNFVKKNYPGVEVIDLR